MNLLDKYKSAGVKTFTVRNNEAIADNPYDELNDKREWTLFERLPLPPLPTSGIPDGTVSIEDVEEQEQAQDTRCGLWTNKRKDEQFHPNTPIRTALIPKALRKGEEEKPEDIEELKSQLNTMVEHWESKGFKQMSNPQDLNTQKSIQPQEQTAEGIENKELFNKFYYLFPDKHRSDFGFNEAVACHNVAASQLAQYKEGLIAKLEEIIEDYKKAGMYVEAHGLEYGLNLAIKNT